MYIEKACQQVYEISNENVSIFKTYEHVSETVIVQ